MKNKVKKRKKESRPSTRNALNVWVMVTLLLIVLLKGILILPVDRDARTLPRQTGIEFYAVLASVLHRDSPQEPAKDRTVPLRPITLRRPSQRLNHQILRENSRTLKNRAKFSLSVLKTRKRKEVM